MGKTYVIAGTGFKGFCDCLELLKTPGNKVYMIDPTPFFGGVFYSLQVNGFNVDKGVHVFDSVPKDLAVVVEDIMDGKVKDVEFISESAFNGKVTEGYSLPDLASMDDESIKNKITEELLIMASEGRPDGDPSSLQDVFNLRYGQTAGKIFGEIFKKIYLIDASKLEPSALAKTSLGRMKHLDDVDMMELKKDPYLDSVLAARRKTVGKVDDFVSIYPDTGEAMRGWCERAQVWLEKKGVDIGLGERIVKITDHDDGVLVQTDQREIKADKVIWANDNIKALASSMGFDYDLASLEHTSSLLLITMITEADKIKDFTYLQNFDPNAVNYRIASAGIFSGQIKEDGTSFITCECPIQRDGDDWNNAEDVADKAWLECKHLGVVSEDAQLVDRDIAKVPVAIRMPKIGYRTKLSAFKKEVDKRSENVIFRDTTPFYRREIYLESLDLIDHL